MRPGKLCEPDIVLLQSAYDLRHQDAFWLGADLVVEVVSPDQPERETREKVRDYAGAGIPEYWIVNPLDETVTVLTLEGEASTPHGIFRRGQRAISKSLDGFGCEVNDIFDAQ
jgi:Uma2 family endonuclease